MRKPATVWAVLASQNSSLSEETIQNLVRLPIKCNPRRDGRRLSTILKKISSGKDMDSFLRLYDAIELVYPFHRDELQKAFREATL